MATLQSTTVSTCLNLTPTTICNCANGYAGISSTNNQLTYSQTAYAWASSGAMICARINLASAGTQNSALVFGGAVPAAASAFTEAYNGTSWSSATGLITARRGLAGAGTQNAALSIGGSTATSPTVTTVTCVQAYNGTSWSACTGLTTARFCLGGNGTTNAALAVGGGTPTSLACVESFNGSTWSVNTPTPTLQGSNSTNGITTVGTQNSALAFGGFPGNILVSFTYNGNGWSTGACLIYVRTGSSGAGTATSALSFGGTCLIPLSCTEIYAGNVWSITTPLITARSCATGAGTQTSALFAGSPTTTEKFSATGGCSSLTTPFSKPLP